MPKPIMIALIVLGVAAIACGAGSQLAGDPPEDQLSGQQVFESLGCPQCHDGVAAAVAAPMLQGLYGQQVQIEGGGSVTADEVYLRESILSPKAKIVRGYQPIMPEFQGRISEQELDALIEYIRSLNQ